MTTRRTPKVSIGMPAYNSERTIRDALDCLLRQDFVDIELIVSDNASTDGTWAIVQEYAGRDMRVVPLRQAQNIGANGNYSAVARAARGHYFKWASSNDWCGPQFVSRCVEHLDHHPEAVLVAPRTRLFQDRIEDGSDYDGDRAFEHPDAVQRFIDVTDKMRLNNVLNGLVRMDALRRTRLIEHYHGADIVLVGHLALMGRVDLLETRDFGRRMDRASATAMMDAAAVQRHHHPRRTLRALFPSWRFLSGCALAVLACDLAWRQKWRALNWVAHLMRWRGPELGRELVEGLRYPLSR